MTPDELSRLHETLGNAVTKLISEHARALESLPVTSRATPDDLKKLFEEPLPIHGAPAQEILDKFARDIGRTLCGSESSLLWPVQSDAFAIGVWADALSSSLNQTPARGGTDRLRR